MVQLNSLHAQNISHFSLFGLLSSISRVDKMHSARSTPAHNTMPVRFIAILSANDYYNSSSWLVHESLIKSIKLPKHIRSHLTFLHEPKKSKTKQNKNNSQPLIQRGVCAMCRHTLFFNFFTCRFCVLFNHNNNNNK